MSLMRSARGVGACFSRFAASRSRSEAAILALAAIVAAILAWLTFRRATTPWSSMPDADYWGNVSGLITESGVKLDLKALFHHNNEHIVPIPKLIYVANYLLTSGSNTGLIIYSLFAGSACTFLLLLLARPLFSDTPWRLLLCAVLFPLVMFSAKLTHSYFLGMSGTIWLTADLFVIASAACFAKAITTERPGWLLGSLAFGMLGVLAYSTAAYILLVLLIYCFANLWRPALPGPRSTPLLIGTIAAIVLVLGLGLAHRNQPPGHPEFQFDVLGLAEFVLVYLGNALTTGPLRVVAGLFILTAGALAIRSLGHQGRLKETLLFAVLFLFAPFNALMTGIGRLGYGVKIAATSRYQSVTAITVIATITLILAALPQDPGSRRARILRNATFVVLICCAVVIALDRSYVENYAARNERKVIAEIALRQGIEGDNHLKAATPSRRQFERVLPVLRAVRHAPFHWRSRCEKLLGQSIPDAGVPGPAVGRIETLSVYKKADDSGRAMALSGFAERKGTAAECIVVVDGSGTVIGAGASVSERSDLERNEGRSLGRIGWQAVATLPPTTTVCALALFPGDAKPRPLADCKHVAADAQR
jgi:hypothetical protein